LTAKSAGDTSKKLLERANANITKYLNIFTQIYDSNMDGSMHLTVGLDRETTTWHIYIYL
jgi:hypothetical protein